MALRIKSAKKKHRQSLKRKARNNFVKSTLKTKVKDFYSALEEQDLEKSSQKLKDVVSAYDRAASKGVVHSKNASRHISRLSKKVHELSSSS